MKVIIKFLFRKDYFSGWYELLGWLKIGWGIVKGFNLSLKIGYG